MSNYQIRRGNHSNDTISYDVALDDGTIERRLLITGSRGEMVNPSWHSFSKQALSIMKKRGLTSLGQHAVIAEQARGREEREINKPVSVDMFGREENEKDESDAEEEVESAPVFKRASKKGLFSKVGVEPTFYPSIEFPDVYMRGELWTGVFDIFIQRFLNVHQDNVKHEWISEKAYNDSSVLEVPTNKEYSSLPELMKDYRKLLSVMNRYSFKPSSIIQPDSDGGCHINFDLTELRSKYDNELIALFCQNMLCFLNNYPSAVWGFLHPEDNESSDVYTSCPDNDDMESCTHKGYCITVRGCDSRIEYIELRMFMMPRSAAEFQFHIEYANALMKYIWNKTIKSPHKQVFEIKHESYHLHKYKYEQAKEELLSVFKWIGMDTKKLKRFGKLEMLAQRFKLGKNHLC